MSTHQSPLDPLFAENGFTVVRGLWPAEEASALAEALVSACAPARDATVAMSDLPNKQPWMRPVVFDPRLRAALGACLGPRLCFARDFSLQINRHSVGWHRDAACIRFGRGGDYQEATHPYGVVKLIFYLKGANAGLAVLPGSHRDPMTDIRFDESPDHYRRLGPGETVNRRFNRRPDVRPVVIDAAAGDAIIFDLRLLHCARSLDEAGKTWILQAPAGDAPDWHGEKVVLHLCFGLDNIHTDRFISYLRYVRPELYPADMPEAFVADLAAQGLLPSAGLGNLFERDPGHLDGIYHRQGAYAADLSAARSKRARVWLDTVLALLDAGGPLAIWGIAPELEAVVGTAPGLRAAIAAGRITVVDQDQAGRPFRGTTVVAPTALSAGATADAMPVVLAPYCPHWREHLRREATRLGIAATRIIDISFDPDLEFLPVNAYDPGWKQAG